MRPLILVCLAALPLAACGDDRIPYGESSPPLLYAPTPAPAYVPRPGVYAPPGGAPYAVPGEPSATYIGPGEARPVVAPNPAGCAQTDAGIVCGGGGN
jgi:hypothetical protein